MNDKPKKPRWAKAKALAYRKSREMEEAARTPKTPYVSYAGQFEMDSAAWDTAPPQPHAWLQAAKKAK